jgi:hypothetical protein
MNESKRDTNQCSSTAILAPSGRIEVHIARLQPHHYSLLLFAPTGILELID